VTVLRVETLHEPCAPPPATALSIELTSDGLSCRMRAAQGVLSQESATTLASMLTSFLRVTASTPQAELCRVPLLSEKQLQSLLQSSNASESEFPRDACVHHLFMAQAALRPNAPAVVFGDNVLTYAELDARSSRLAWLLRARGIARNALVGLFLERSADLVVSLLAIMKAGAAYVPLDPIYPPERVAYMLKDACVALVITDTVLEASIRTAGVPTLVASRDAHAWAEGADSALAGATADDLAYVIYTSGSTGQPKGVELGHRGLTNLLWSMRERPGFSERDRLLAITTICFDIAGLELFLPLVTGGVVEVVPASVAANGFNLLAQLQRSRPTVMQATPATWRMLIDVGWEGDPELKVLCGGEHLPEDLARALLLRAGEVWNLYGPTETTIWSSASRVQPSNPVLIGRPIANTSFFVLDPHGELVPPGVPGELHIGGSGVARGYRGRPELTQEKFVASALAAGSGLYRTGDRVRRLPDGNFEYLGRSGDQIKLNGYRLELGEVEHALRGYADVCEAAAAVDATTTNAPRLVGYLVLREPGASIDAQALRRHLLGSLPDYMVPGQFVVLERMPLTPNGKTDRKALPRARRVAAAMSAGGSHGTQMEQRVAAIWCRILHIDQVALDDNFFDVGGKSLDLLRLVVDLQRQLEPRVTAVDVFKHPTIRSMARHLTDTHGTSQPAPKTAERTPTAINRSTALSALRQRRGMTGT
ncbi:MAG TPA: amino acid adenylation domain-containing protein, partial [Polyangiaceae bacterium]|jgi:amino acid adenylation domain-containing protein